MVVPSLTANLVYVYKVFKIQIHNNRIFGLDILRALAIFFVVYGHGANFIENAFFKKMYTVLIFDGVSIFFVLSGFLIGAILIKTIEKQGVGFKTLFNFWIKRWFRTLPNYYLILIAITSGAFFFKKLDLSTAKPYFFFLQNLNQSHPDFFPEAWSLAVEEWFYIIIPILLFFFIGLFKIHIKKAFLVVSILVIVIVTFIRYSKYMSMEIDDVERCSFIIRSQVIDRLDGIMFGVLGAYLAHYNKKGWIRNKKILFFMGIAILLLHKISIDAKWYEHSNLYFFVFSFTVASIGTLLLLPLLSEYKVGKGFFYKIITYLSLISYSMYLINLTIIQNIVLPFTTDVMFSNIDGGWAILLKYGLYWFFTITGSILLYKYFEYPIMSLREKFLIRKKT